MKNNALTKDEVQNLPRIWPSVAGVAGISVVLVILGHVWDAVHGSRLVNSWSITVVAAIVLSVGWHYRKPITDWLVSLQFSIALLGVILLATAVGTVVLQGQSPGDFRAKYGPSTGPFLQMLGADDIFHSFPFRGLLALLSLSLGAVIVRKRAWRPSEWFFLFNHGGVIVILLGGLIGCYGGLKGFIDIHQGEVAKKFVLNDRFGKRTEETVPLDFGLKLDKFEIDRLVPEWRLYVYEDHKGSGMPTVSRSLEEATAWTEAGHAGESFRLVAVYPDFDLKTELQEVPPGEGRPAAQIRSFDKEGNVSVRVIYAGVEDEDSLYFPENRTLLRFYWSESDVKVQTETRPERHVIAHKLVGSEAAEDIVVKVGEEREIGAGVTMTVTAFYPDFGYDGKKKQAYSRSTEPKNPALELNVRYPTGTTERRWLFANKPDFNTGSGPEGEALAFSYRYFPERKAADREVALIGSTKQLLDYRHGELTERLPLPDGPEEKLAKGVAAKLLKLVECAREVQTPISRSDKWRRPAAEVEIRAGGVTEKVFLKSNAPVEIGPAGSLLVFQTKPEDIKSFRSSVTVLSGGNTVHTATISVNHPLSWGGYRFYQSNFRREDPTYSGILVVKDPGLGVAYLGFIMMCIGIICRFYVTPWLARKRAPVERTTA
ncbi:MAG: cytochrome c biogenesis protein ResB [Planctomycetes bacterium]|nr:cytochrome c biogenesis protein ResB [Planctomycetota bacterium]